MPSDRSPGKPPLPPPLSGFGENDERRRAAAAEYGRKFGDKLDGEVELGELDDAPTPVAPMTLPPSSPTEARDEPGRPNRPNLEPIAPEAHPPQNRRLPTQPPAKLELELELPSEEPPTSARSQQQAPQRQQGGVQDQHPPKLSPRHSPAPVRRGLFSSDRVTNLLAGAAVGLLLTIFPAKKLAQSYEIREVEPRLADLEESIAQPLAVDAGLVESPEAIAADVHAGRSKVRRRFMLIWLLAGLPIGLGLGLAPRPGD